MEKFINEYLEFIRQDYAKWSAQSPTEVRIRMTKEFQESVGFEVGSKWRQSTLCPFVYLP